MMNNAWKEIIAEHTPTLAESDSSGVDKSTELNGSSWLAPLSSRGVLKISGADALEFLHGQFSNDLKQLNTGQWQLSSYSTPKGRLLAVFRIAKVGEDFYIEMPESTKEAFQKRLTMFVMRSKVTIDNLSEELLISAIVGPDSPKVMHTLGINAPSNPYEASVSESHDVLVLRECGDTQRYVILATSSKTTEMWQTADSSLLRTAENTWALSQIANGQPDVFDETKEQFVAQMMNLQVIGAVNFKKGCYPGQEVIARLHYLGKLKRRMYRFSATGQTLPVSGSEIVLVGETEAAGKVASAAFSTEGKIELLAVMKVASVESDDVLQLASGETLEILELPYAFAEEPKAS